VGRGGQAPGETDQDQSEQQEQAVMVGPADAGIGEYGRLSEHGQAGEQPGVSIERRRRGPGERNHGEREQDRADQHAPQMQRLREPEQRLEQPGACQQQRIQRPGPVLDMPFRRIDAREPGVKPVPAVVQREDAAQTHVRVGVDQGAVEHRQHPAQRKHSLAEHDAAQRDQDQPAKRHLVRRAAGGNGRLRPHLAFQTCDGERRQHGRRAVNFALSSRPSGSVRRALCCNAE
jgi:hypothetical protein